VLLDVYGGALRFYAQHARDAFVELWQDVRQWAPNYRPASGLARQLTPVFGYPTAEIAAGVIREVLKRT
jgi:uncharacterized membrane protein (UPF0182 family)